DHAHEARLVPWRLFILSCVHDLHGLAFCWAAFLNAMLGRMHIFTSLHWSSWNDWYISTWAFWIAYCGPGSPLYRIVGLCISSALDACGSGRGRTRKSSHCILGVFHLLAFRCTMVPRGYDV